MMTTLPLLFSLQNFRASALDIRASKVNGAARTPQPHGLCLKGSCLEHRLADGIQQKEIMP